MQQQPDVRIRHAISDKEDRSPQCVRAKLYVQRGIERKSIEKVRLRDDKGRVVGKVAMIFDDVGYIIRRTGNVLGIADLGVWPPMGLERRLEISIIIRRVDGR